MECKQIHSWTSTRLVGEYLDLAITFLLLCGSTLAYAASRFLAFFGMSLPCPCNHCLHKFLLETQTISTVQMSVRSQFPFDLVCAKDQHTQKGFVVWPDGYFEDEHDYLVGGSVYASANNSLESFQNGVAEEDRFKQKGTRTVALRPKEWSRRKRKNHISCLKLSSPKSTNYVGAQNESSTEESYSKRFCSNEAVDESKALQEQGNKVKGQLEVKHGDENAIWLLEQALEEEQTARAALYIELEKERSAAASAADEAMAMVLRLQEEKAIVEMNARQYKRIVEEKSVFDAEEMNLLKEILLRRERETHFLEKEVEAYRLMMVGNVQWDSQRYGVARTQNDALVSQMELPGLQWDNFEIDDCTTDAYSRKGEEVASSLQEKMIVSLDAKQCQNVEMKHPVAQILFEKPGIPQGSAFLEKTTTPLSETQEHKNETSSFEGVQTDQKNNLEENFAQCDNAAYSRTEGHSVAVNEAESSVYDVHVVECHMNTTDNLRTDDTECGPVNTSIISPRERSSFYEASKIKEAEIPNRNKVLVEPEQNFVRSQTDICLSLPATNTWSGEVHNGMRRNSLLSVDNERLRIESEVGLLREKIRVVQEGRKKLNHSLDLKERQLHALDDMANQLQEIRHLTSPGKVARHSSLPPQSSKQMSRKRNKCLSRTDDNLSKEY